MFTKLTRRCVTRQAPVSPDVTQVYHPSFDWATNHELTQINDTDWFIAVHRDIFVSADGRYGYNLELIRFPAIYQVYERSNLLKLTCGKSRRQTTLAGLHVAQVFGSETDSLCLCCVVFVLQSQLQLHNIYFSLHPINICPQNANVSIFIECIKVKRPEMYDVFCSHTEFSYNRLYSQYILGCSACAASH